MMDNSSFWSWVHDHADQDPARLALTAVGKASDFDVRQAIVQIQARKKFGKKLHDTLARFPDFFFPSLLNGEQSTSDLLAAYHAGLIDSGATVVDLTAGLGIDAMHMAARANAVTAVERESDLAKALAYNAAGLGIANLTVVNSSCEDFLATCISEGRRFDVAFIDPARRGDGGKRLFALADCSPDVVALMPDITRVADRLIIKASPMLDISGVINALPVKPGRVIATGTPTECKELVIMVDLKSTASDTTIEAVTLPGGEPLTFTLQQERECPLPEVVRVPQVGAYVFEPFPSVMKTGVFRLLGRRYSLQMFHANTKVLYSSEAEPGFPGNIYIIEKVLPYASRVIKRFAKEYPQINVAVRNFGMSADALRAKLGVRDGGSLRLYALTDHRGERILLVTKMATPLPAQPSERGD